MKSTSEIVEMEILSGIDKFMHALLLEYQESCSNGLDIFSMREINRLKRRIPEYIDKQYKAIISENLHDSVRIYHVSE